jgi:hypothetical protein
MKILHDNIFKGSIIVDKLGIKQIDYDIYAPSTIEFNQENEDNVIMNVVSPIQTTSTTSRLNVIIKGQILSNVLVAISSDNKLIVNIFDSKVSLISSSLGPYPYLLRVL